MAKRGPAPMSTAERLEAARRHQEHTLSERNRLLALLCTHYPAHIIPVYDSRPEWQHAVCMHLPSGVVAWKLSEDEIGLDFEFLLPPTDDNECPRHTVLEKLDRLQSTIDSRIPAVSKVP